MNQLTLKKIAKLGYDISWKYDHKANSIIIHVQKENHIIEKTIDFDIDSRAGGCANINFYLDRFLVDIFYEIQKREEGENNDNL